MPIVDIENAKIKLTQACTTSLFKYTSNSSIEKGKVMKPARLVAKDIQRNTQIVQRKPSERF